jgi:large subunit ribosomal protein L4
MKIKVYNQKGQDVEEMNLPNGIFDIVVKPDLLAQVIRYYDSLQRKKIAKVKDRSEVRGGGKKPWRQKGTGRARHGSNRSPIWIGGGVTFGPLSQKNYKKNINKKMQTKALFGVLSGKVKDDEVIILDKIDIKDNKTKNVSEILDGLSKVKKDIIKKKTIFVLENKNDNFSKSAANIKSVRTIPSNSLNAHFLLKSKYLIIEKNVIKQIENIFVISAKKDTGKKDVKARKPKLKEKIEIKKEKKVLKPKIDKKAAKAKKVK